LGGAGASPAEKDAERTWALARLLLELGLHVGDRVEDLVARRAVGVGGAQGGVGEGERELVGRGEVVRGCSGTCERVSRLVVAMMSETERRKKDAPWMPRAGSRDQRGTASRRATTWSRWARSGLATAVYSAKATMPSSWSRVCGRPGGQRGGAGKVAEGVARWGREEVTHEEVALTVVGVAIETGGDAVDGMGRGRVHGVERGGEEGDIVLGRGRGEVGGERAEQLLVEVAAGGWAVRE